MRNPISVLSAARKWASAGPTARDDGARRQLVLVNTIAMLAGIALAFPVSVVFLGAGSVLPFAATIIVAVLVALTAVLMNRGAAQAAIACQAGAVALAGLMLSLADPAIVDFGVGLSILAALYMVVLPKARWRAIGWAAPVMVLAASVWAGFSAVPQPGDLRIGVLSLIALAVVGVMAGATINRLGTLAVGQPGQQARTLAALAEGLLGAVVHYDRKGAPLFVSRAASAMLGCRHYELDGAGLFERVHVMDRPAYRKAISDASNAGTTATLEVRMRRDDAGGSGAQYLWVEVSLAPMTTQSPAASRDVLAVLRDISGRKDAERHLETARRQAEDASQAKSRFLAVIGHELRTPLNAIVGFSDMMAEGIGGELSPIHRDYAGHISQSGHHLLEVVNMLLDMSRIEAGKFEVHTELFAPQALVEPCLQMVERLGRDRQIVVQTSVPERLPRVLGDERACRQILINLLSNAIKFSHDGGKVGLAIKRQGRMLNISVTDSGIGMLPETVQRIGEPFLQAQNGLTRRYEGTGLGLSIVKGLVALHEGRLEVVSEPGTGTTVCVLLPIDGPAQATRTATIRHLDTARRDSDEDKWLKEEKRSATQ